MSARSQQSFIRPFAAPIAAGATAPDGGVVDAIAWSTTLRAFVRWSGTAWEASTVGSQSVPITGGDGIEVIGGDQIPVPDGSETKIIAGDGIDLTGTGTTETPYEVSLGVDIPPPPDGSETKVTGGTGIAVTGAGTTPAPYVVALTDEPVNALTATGAPLTLPAPATAPINLVTLTGNPVLTFPALAAGRTFTLALRQDTTGSRMVTWPATVRWAGGTAPTLTTGANKIDVFTFTSFDGVSWLGFTSGKGF